MSNDAEMARRSFSASQEILRKSANETREFRKEKRTEEVRLSIEAIRRYADKLCADLEGDDNDTIDRVARLLGAEVLKVQQLTLRRRARKAGP